MSEEQTRIVPESLPETPEQQEVVEQPTEVLEAIVQAHEDHGSKIEDHDATIKDLQKQVEDLKTQLESFQDEPKQEQPSEIFVNRSVDERTISGDLLDAVDTRIKNTEADIDTDKGWGGDLSAKQEELKGDKDWQEYLKQRPAGPEETPDAETSEQTPESEVDKPEDNSNVDSEKNPEAYENPYKDMSMEELLTEWAKAEDASDKTKSMDIQDVIQDKLINVSGITEEHKMNLIDTAHNEMMKRRKGAEADTLQAEPLVEAVEAVPATSEETVNTGEEEGESPEGPREIAPVNLGNLPELLAREKNLFGGDKEALAAELDRVKQEIIDNIDDRVHNFLIENPDATEEQARQFAKECYVEISNQLQQNTIDAIDGKGYIDANGEKHGSSRLRRFGAWMDRNSGKIKNGMLVVGVVGAVALTGGIAAGAIVPAFALGTGTAIGAAKGAAMGLAMSRHGSKESAFRQIDLVNDKEFQKMFESMDPTDMAKFGQIAEYTMGKSLEAADKDHALNVKKSKRAAIIGGAMGAIFGSITFNSPETINTTQTVEVPNQPPTELASHQIQPGELTGQSLQTDLNSMGIDGSRFVNLDGSTNMDAIYQIFTPKEWHNMATLGNGTHSMAGADSLADLGMRQIIQYMVNNHDWGTHTETIVSSITQLAPNLPANIAWAIANTFAIGAATRGKSRSTMSAQQPVSGQPAAATPAPSPTLA